MCKANKAIKQCESHVKRSNESRMLYVDSTNKNPSANKLNWAIN